MKTRIEYMMDHLEEQMKNHGLTEEAFFYLLFYYHGSGDPTWKEANTEFQISKSQYYNIKEQINNSLDLSTPFALPEGVAAWEGEREFFQEVRKLREKSPKLTFSGFKLLFYIKLKSRLLNWREANNLGITAPKYYRLKKGALSDFYGVEK